MAKSYAEKLRDPRWQKKRLEVLERAEWACEHCGGSEKTLHVHHGYYASGFDPWEYRSDTLHCLCEECHETARSLQHDLHIEIAKLPLESQVYLMEVVRNWHYLPMDEQMAAAQELMDAAWTAYKARQVEV